MAALGARTRVKFLAFLTGSFNLKPLLFIIAIIV